MARMARWAAVSSMVCSVAGQDPGSAMALGLAGQVASVVVSEAEKEMKKSMSDDSEPTPCIGPHCCQESTCMHLPGMGCSRERGPTKCIGSRTFPPARGTCACLVGACSIDGKCSSQGLQNTLEPAPAPAPAVAAAPDAAFTSAPDTSGDFGVWHGQGGSTGGADDFSKWHTGPDRLFEAVRPLPREDLTVPALCLGTATVGLLAGLGVLTVRVARHLRERRSRPEEMSLVDSDSDSVDA